MVGEHIRFAGEKKIDLQISNRTQQGACLYPTEFEHNQMEQRKTIQHPG